MRQGLANSRPLGLCYSAIGGFTGLGAVRPDWMLIDKHVGSGPADLRLCTHGIGSNVCRL
jgi:hypothetical protein